VADERRKLCHEEAGDCALQSSRLFSQEREVRAALERADESKTNFISLAAHEPRTPAATMHGLVETIQMRRGELAHEQLAELETVLREQTTRLTTLVEQLLDLSRSRPRQSTSIRRRWRFARGSRRSSREPPANGSPRSPSTSTRGSSRRSIPTRSTASSRPRRQRAPLRRRAGAGDRVP
jgi:His Kinase A (phospho-acceptor) domain